jgi:hypothetical protein
MNLKNAFLCLSLLSGLAGAQITLPDTPPPRAVVNPAMLIQFKGQKIEILPQKRAVKQAIGLYTLVDAQPSDAFTKDSLGVGYSYTINAHVVLNGEISFKLNPGYTAANVGTLKKNSSTLIMPGMHIIQAATPLDYLKIMGELQSNPAVSWVEPYIIRAKFN